MRKFYMVCLFFILAALTTLTGCDETDNDTVTLTGNGDNGGTLAVVPGVVAPRPEPTPGQPPERAPWPTGASMLERGPAVALQLTPLTPGEELVVLHTNHGDITLRLFPQAAPVAVENFLTHAVNGFFDGLTFHRVMPGFMIQGGCAEGTGMAGRSIWGTGFGPEHNYDLWHFNGALAAAQTMHYESIGSQFYIVHSSSLTADMTAFFNDLIEHGDEVIYPFDWDGTGPRLTNADLFPREMLEHYIRVGGTPHLDFPFNSQPPNHGHTVFGHVVDGMDAVNSIAATPLVPVAFPNSPSTPVDDVVIERVSVIIYQG